MSKIKQTDITKLSQLEQQMEQLKEQKKQEAQLSNKIGGYFLNELDLNRINSSDELYKIMDKVIEEFNKNIEQNGSNRNNENLKENEINQNSK
ncbi:hypothetical protein OPX35_11275 [Staphylococcus epidermidis]|uniref:hypothetical protein n=1 Tax=Staphylococcus epidermidis TaxID=1282 RepID=UPI00224002BC|nr:hypothetical protein [Staphylococcus epidermidis]MCW7859131.1 hypothetical protein [Staphylococcus epidermidis]MCW7872225.1 hypothetical protein [Staphylococcus epidermidis]MCW7907535.1 hypothetical protein [Staphylococcus epidermidis]MCW7909764.1 hypothetical protein [Staphylococcus epidermidis]MCW7911981.1 hypothetical protein [Staphylococcus epidermidis]